MDRLDAMRAFRRVIELGNFGKAAKDLGVSPAGLSKQIRQLEEYLGAVLVHRTTRAMSLSEAGSDYFAECCRILDQLDEIERGISDNSAALTGRLRVNAPLSFGITVLSPILRKFLTTYPDITMDLTLDDRLLDPVSTGFDVSIRVRAALEDSSLVARKIADVEQVICAAPSYLQARGAPESANDLRQHSCISYSLADRSETWWLNGPDGPTMVSMRPRLSANSSILLRDMLVAGLGVGALPLFLAGPPIERGELVRMLPNYTFPVRHVFAVYPTGRHMQRKVRAFIEFLADEFHHRGGPAGSPDRGAEPMSGTMRRESC